MRLRKGMSGQQEEEEEEGKKKGVCHLWNVS